MEIHQGGETSQVTAFTKRVRTISRFQCATLTIPNPCCSIDIKTGQAENALKVILNGIKYWNTLRHGRKEKHKMRIL